MQGPALANCLHNLDQHFKRAAMGEVKNLTFSIPSTVDAIDNAVARVVSFAQSAGADETALFGIDMAAREALVNAVKHGNLLDEDKSVEVVLGTDSDGLLLEVRDRGNGFSPEEVPDPTNPENLLKSSGRGLLFMRNFMDDAAWRTHPEGGTVVSLRKRL